jgi:S1-C subfamily serine protease
VPTIAVVALVSALLGGVVAFLGARAVGDDGGATSTVYVPTSGREINVGAESARRASARPLLGNGFAPDRIYASRSPGVVTVFAFFGEDGADAAQGSGFVVSPEGEILTSAHVITDVGEGNEQRRASQVFVAFKDGDRVKAEIVGWDAYDDVGVLRVAPDVHELAPVPLGDSERVHPGDPVAAMGSPFGNEDSIAVGVVSATHRSIDSLSSVYKVVDALQTDAPITHGNSGGPLFDARGRVIGINAQIRSESGGAEGVGFAIPINAAVRSMRQLTSIGRVVYAYLGVSAETLTPSIARHLGYDTSRGAIVASVREGSPADRAGLRGGSEETFNGQSVSRGGDVIAAMDGTPVRSADDVVRAVAEKLPGQTAELTILRDDRRQRVRVRLGTRPSEVDER